MQALAKMCHDVFANGSVSYAYTTIPTYPRCAHTCLCLSASGMCGFIATLYMKSGVLASN